MRPEEVFDPLLQQERTSLAWERTAFAGLVVGLLMTRLGATMHLALGAIGIAVVCISAGLLVWAGRHYDDLHVTLRAGESPVHPSAAKAVGIWATVVTGLATVLMVAAVLSED